MNCFDMIYVNKKYPAIYIMMAGYLTNMSDIIYNGIRKTDPLSAGKNIIQIPV